MIHNEAAEGPNSHWAVNHNCYSTHVLVQVQNKHGDQARAMLTAYQARRMIEGLQKAIEAVEADAKKMADNRQK